MFTGLVLGCAPVSASVRAPLGLRLSVATDSLKLSNAKLGDSIAVDGVCLTVVEIGSCELAFDVSSETLARTTIGALQVGDVVNIESALTLASPLGGHLVSGHVDGVGAVRMIEAVGESQHWRISYPSELAAFIATKGSIAVQGVSLTVNAVNEPLSADHYFDVMLIPHTLERTSFAQLKVGDAVNLEVDMMARYAARYVAVTRQQ